MTRTLELFVFGVLLLIGGAQETWAQSNNGPHSKPSLLSLEQQQNLLEQLAQLQRQTQQLLAAQQSLAAVAAAAGVSGGPARQQAPREAEGPVEVPLQASTQVGGNSIGSQGQQQRAQAIANDLAAAAQRNSAQGAPGADRTQVDDKAKATSISGSSSGAQNELPQSSASPPLPQGPQINWGKCPELEPSEQEKLSKAGVITKCLESTPLPGNITRESVEQHREQIAACALRAEGWFTNSGTYDYGKAEKEIKHKQLKGNLEEQVLLYHSQCKAESEEKYPTGSNSIIAQIQLYQACMDYFISDVCGIEVNEPEATQLN